MAETEELKIVYKDIYSLKESGYNPKKATPKEDEDIRTSLKRFGFVDPLVVNIHEDRLDVIVTGHQRVRIAKEMGYTKVPCTEVNLPLEKEKELNLRLSKNVAAIDQAMLAVYFQKEFLKDIGFREDELKAFVTDYEKELKQYDNTNCAYPLVPKFSEKYDAVIIVSKNSIDTAYLETVLGITKAQSYKNSRTGKAIIIEVDQFRDHFLA